LGIRGDSLFQVTHRAAFSNAAVRVSVAFVHPSG
jgi:hypothetical protein